MKRRDFIKTAVISSATTVNCSSPLINSFVQPSPEEMSYTILGKTGIKVSNLGFGSHLSKPNMADPSGRDKHIQYGIEMGINLFDIYDHTYFQFDPMSKSLANHSNTIISLFMESKEVEKRVEEVLRIFSREYIDLYRISANDYEKLDKLLSLREKGKIHAVGIVSHDEESLVRAVIKYGDDLDYMMIPYNFVHNKALPNQQQNSFTTFMKLAKKYNYGIIGMKPFVNEMLLDFAKENGYVGGSKDRGVSVPTAALRYALSTGVIHVSIPAMNSIREIEENLQAIYQPKLNPLEKEILEEIDLLAMEKKWSYLKPGYEWLEQWIQPGVFYYST
ncbi:MAG: hypothetical protein HOC71_15775 [Candidatus Latescibacteria bacterium]|jgi:predicted aldo/keto reductase-like oxidoreductase|nr:hypothetical protein [Candidatus Latescibacterota bacterium]